MDIKTPGAGWTTITQALVKIFYFKRKFKPGFFRLNKIRQMFIARFAYHSRLSKDIQLKLFINEATFGTIKGKNIVGFREAAEIYFQKPFQNLTEDEFIKLVATFVGPSQFNPMQNPQRNAERVHRIKRLLAGECQVANFKDVYYENCK